MRNLLAGAVVALTLAGCAVQPPSALTDEELRDYSGMMQDRSWYDVGGETRPLVEPTLIPAGDMEQVLNDCELSFEACALTFIAEPGDIGYLSSSELSYVYDYYASELVPCLATEGLTLGIAPTRAEFTHAGWISWDPYTELGADLPPSRAEGIREKCPPYPPMPFSGAYG